MIEAMGRSYEELEVGAVYRSRFGRTVLEADNVWFTLLTLNTNPIHFDAAYAATTEWKQPLVDSTFTLALVTGLSVTDISERGVNLGWREVRLPAPVFAGDTIRAETEVLAKRESQVAARSGHRHGSNARAQPARRGRDRLRAHDHDSARRCRSRLSGSCCGTPRARATRTTCSSFVGRPGGDALDRRRGRRPRSERSRAIERWLARWEDDGIGHFCIVRDGRVLGRVGLPRLGPRAPGRARRTRKPATLAETELGWTLAREHWGHGYATEAALAVRDWAYAERGVERIISLIAPDNARSIRVAEKLGAAPEETISTFHGPATVWVHPR